MSATVVGAPLEAGERVIYFHRADLTSARVLYVIVGLIFLPIVVGLYFFYRAIAFASNEDHYYVITDRRLFTADLRGRVRRQYRLAQVAKVRHRMQPGNQRYEVQGPGGFADTITFRTSEKHDAARLEKVLRNLQDPDVLASLPSVDALP
ncbi:MAG: hypothetical protein U0235_03460 [Polyangiaceae bacterium]